jgi:hypothetical protein
VKKMVMLTFCVSPLVYVCVGGAGEGGGQDVGGWAGAAMEGRRPRRALRVRHHVVYFSLSMRLDVTAWQTYGVSGIKVWDKAVLAAALFAPFSRPPSSARHALCVQVECHAGVRAAQQPHPPVHRRAALERAAQPADARRPGAWPSMPYLSPNLDIIVSSLLM